MIQQILTYVIIAAAVGYALLGFYRIIKNTYKKNNGSVCSGCASCEMKRELSSARAAKKQ
ncbi:MAG TPA: FeoB-associated Cys-rich membrane protein [Bacteroidales bacterium]|nr:FeoB-associated Cys-rich membrane protein [Bacteroidales bacterium]